METNQRYTLVVGRQRVPVTAEVYHAYYKEKERERYGDKLSARYTLSLEACREQGVPVEALMACKVKSLEDRLLEEEVRRRLVEALDALSEEERALLAALFLCNRSERQWAAETGVPQRTIHDRKQRLLKKLKKSLG